MNPDKTETAIEDDRLMAELVEARQEMFALKAELDQATFSRLYPAQVKLIDAEKVARAKWNDLFSLYAPTAGPFAIYTGTTQPRKPPPRSEAAEHWLVVRYPTRGQRSAETGIIRNFPARSLGIFPASFALGHLP